MTKSKTLTFDLGHNVYNQPISIKRSREHQGLGDVWEIHRGEANQRDDQVTIFGLTSELILNMAEAVRKVQASGL